MTPGVLPRSSPNRSLFFDIDNAPASSFPQKKEDFWADGTSCSHELFADTCPVSDDKEQRNVSPRVLSNDEGGDFDSVGLKSTSENEQTSRHLFPRVTPQIALAAVRENTGPCSSFRRCFSAAEPASNKKSLFATTRSIKETDKLDVYLQRYRSPPMSSRREVRVQGNASKKLTKHSTTSVLPSIMQTTQSISSPLSSSCWNEKEEQHGDYKNKLAQQWRQHRHLQQQNQTLLMEQGINQSTSKSLFSLSLSSPPPPLSSSVPSSSCSFSSSLYLLPSTAVKEIGKILSISPNRCSDQNYAKPDSKRLNASQFRRRNLLGQIPPFASRRFAGEDALTMQAVTSAVGAVAFEENYPTAGKTSPNDVRRMTYRRIGKLPKEEGRFDIPSNSWRRTDSTNRKGCIMSKHAAKHLVFESHLVASC